MAKLCTCTPCPDPLRFALLCDADHAFPSLNMFACLAVRRKQQASTVSIHQACHCVYAVLCSEAIITSVVNLSMRPEFGPGVPFEFRELAARYASAIQRVFACDTRSLTVLPLAMQRHAAPCMYLYVWEDYGQACQEHVVCTWYPSISPVYVP